MWAKLQFLMQIVDSPKMNFQGIASREHVYRGIRDCFHRTYKETGLRGLYRGAGMDIKTACLRTALYFSDNYACLHN